MTNTVKYNCQHVPQDELIITSADMLHLVIRSFSETDCVEVVLNAEQLDALILDLQDVRKGMSNV